MAIKQFFSKTGFWLRNQKTKITEMHHIDDQGLINHRTESAEPAGETNEPENSQVIVKTVPSAVKTESLEKLQDGFSKLITQLEDINDNLSRQLGQNEELMNRMEKLPGLMDSFPEVVKNQKELTEQLIGQLNDSFTKQQQFIDAVEKIPYETAKQTDALTGIDHQLAAAADVDTQMAESFNKFNDTLDKLNMTGASQTDSILQMSKTFAASDRYLKYLISRQNKRFMWIFISALGICFAVILIMVGIILLLKQ